MAKAKRSKPVRPTKPVEGPKPVKPIKSETERALEELARKGKISAERAAKAAKIAKKTGASAIRAAALVKLGAEIEKTKSRIAREHKALAPELEAWIETKPQLFKEKLPGQKKLRKLGMAVTPKERRAALGIDPIRARIADILAGKRVKARLDVEKAAAAARKALTQELRGVRGIAKRIGITAATAIARAKEVLVGVTARVIRGIAGGQLFDTPIRETRKRFDPRIMKESPETGRDMFGVSSSNVFSVGFEESEDNPNIGTMYIQFRSGWAYKYKDAPRWLYEGLLSAVSPGRYVWDNIRRGLYPDSVPYGSFEGDGYTRIR